MSRKWNVVLAIALALGLLVLVWGAVYAAARLTERQVQESPSTDQPPPQRERDAEPAVPAISFLDSPNPTCYLPVDGTNACYIEWGYLYVTAGSNYIISMTVNIDGQMRLNSQGFFQNAMYIPANMLSPGFRVNCGVPGASGIPGMGKMYNYTLRARDSNGFGAANYGSLTCPADLVPISQLILNGPDVGIVNTAYSFNAFVFPITATLPITYTWLVSDYSSLIMEDGVTNSQNFIWNTPGIKTITIEARNLSNLVSQTVTILIEPHKIYLPLIQR